MDTAPGVATVSSLQEYLGRLYALETAFRVDDFLLTDEAVARELEGEAFRAVEEKLLVEEGEGGLGLSLYLDPQMLKRLEEARPLESLRRAGLEDFWSVLEGVSHFTYLTFKAQHDRGVRPVELELQAEVDKFVVTALLALAQRIPTSGQALHHWLFELSRPDPALEGDLRRRYRDAGRSAARYCSSLLHRFPDVGPGLLPELRHFYRLDHPGKLHFIEKLA
ncbi:MAG TPA: hypothetical protein VLV87_03455 [Gammaproteobacteria bacterium]|nr:hypothetical protein [Gammaproteobacteria bacterium]